MRYERHLRVLTASDRTLRESNSIVGDVSCALIFMYSRQRSGPDSNVILCDDLFCFGDVVADVIIVCMF